MVLGRLRAAEVRALRLADVDMGLRRVRVIVRRYAFDWGERVRMRGGRGRRGQLTPPA